ncbi:MAG TPA: 4-hydroxy-3-methylbut-2-enyl diphosphate reductase, partial [Bacteroidales bacterium]|nr:4-hydroxy-3-methylbut-2-enyl diphosphate reductase [Bacteroidales bacterium]
MAKLNLSVSIDVGSGFCFGVVEAIKKVEKILNTGQAVYCLGQIVHNEEEVKRLEKKGMITITNQQYINIKNVTLLFRAHGEPPSSYQIAKQNNIHLIDASCPIVTRLQMRVKKAFLRGENIYIFGKHHHPEIIGLLGQTQNKATVFQSIEELDFRKIPNEITIFSQTTRSKEEYTNVIKILKEKGIKVKVNNTICNEVANRQPEIKKFCRQFDKIIFIAGKKSSNGKVLYKVCKTTNPNSYFVTNISEIDKAWF